jgi:ABC-type sugar transport system ATPase subunit
MISIENLNMQYLYGAKPVEDLTFTVEKGAVLGVFGAEESGKTSLLKCIAGLYPATAGKCEIVNAKCEIKDITKAKPKRRDICLMHSEGGMLWGRTLRYNLGYPLKIRKVKGIEQKVEEAAKIFNLSHLLDIRAKKLAPADIVRANFARASLRAPAAYLIDDIFALCEEGRHDLFIELLPQLKKLADTAPVIFASSVEDEIFGVFDEILILGVSVSTVGEDADD